LLEKQREKIKEIFITVQSEVGRRMIAKVGNKDYSAITLLVQYFTEAKLLFSIPQRAFYPQPKVNSIFVHLRILKKPRVSVNNQEQFFKIIRTCFNQRRKTILNSLHNKLGSDIGKDRIQQILREVGIYFQLRPERISIDEFAKIEKVFYRKGIMF
jgi:16S rRNA (adenine1518-N6/adenine1519-N6)-dimethyltransferase